MPPNDWSDAPSVTPRAYRGSIEIVADTPQASRNGVQISCTVAGDVSLKMDDGSANVVPVDVGLTVLPYAVQTVNSSGTTATATYRNLV